MKTFILFAIFVMVLRINGSKASKLMFILLDGFRWDYLDKSGVNLPGFKRFLENGVRAEYMTSDFPTFSIPNYYSAMTGLHVENHGMVGNDIYDEKFDSYFVLGNSSTWYNPIFWNQSEPIWIQAEKQGKRVYMFHWLGCQVEIAGTKITFCAPYYYEGGRYPGVPVMADSINKGLELFEQNTADVVGVFVENPDSYGHSYGPNSTELNRKLEEIDDVIGQMVHNITEKGLDDKVTVMIFSDHGMIEVSPERIANVTGYIDLNDVQGEILGAGAMVNLWPKEGKIEKVYNNLKLAEDEVGHFNVYRKNEFPEKWHYGNHYRISPIILVADPGWSLLQPLYDVVPSIIGSHGYDPYAVEMRGIFLVSGPDFKKNVQVDNMFIVDIYQLMCHVLQITPLHHNGTWSHVSAMLRDTSSAGIVYPMSFVGTMLCSCLIFLAT